MSQRKLTPCPDSQSDYEPPDPPPLVTYRILAEDGSVIATEDEKKLRTEQVQ